VRRCGGSRQRPFGAMEKRAPSIGPFTAPSAGPGNHRIVPIYAEAVPTPSGLEQIHGIVASTGSRQALPDMALEHLRRVTTQRKTELPN